MKTSDLVSRIITKEWNFFQQTNNCDGRCSCQDDPDTFEIMRASQFVTWPEAALASYEQDLNSAMAEERNPVMEKYAYMMSSTHPEEFAQIKVLLPPVTAAKQQLVKDIVAVNLAWNEECDRLFPHVRGCGRVLHTSQDTAHATSFETYLRGELCTYSEHTLELLAAHVKKAAAENVNLARVSLEHMVKSYGHSSIEELEMHKAKIAEGRR